MGDKYLQGILREWVGLEAPTLIVSGKLKGGQPFMFSCVKIRGAKHEQERIRIARIENQSVDYSGIMY